ncbi:related to ATP-binding cassette protein (ABC) transporter [Pseudozyma flocculosa]|uniref:Related to ATP-binding cassette protein (ABC) transporter n=1 Tax=Pseudozyma flocculosa TaxID=84751 RepID=A0A5C3EV41_9BASI|nr:related to ATP-binding cassette protein (ABC) transporter [Pseudozyma flocculosa]
MHLNQSNHSKVSAEQPVHFGWNNVRFTVKSKKKQGDGVLLDGVSGSISGGQMLAIMGPSGAGKSTLLDVLAGRKPLQSGTLTVNGSDTTSVRDLSGYVEQEDALLGTLTVRETIQYSARLSDPSANQTTLDERVDATLGSLGLSHVANHRIGTPIQRGISGGQKRRVTIGNTLVTLPQILFLDEPTSGLDSATALEVIACIRQMAKDHGFAVLCTIHSPNWETFSQFDSVMLLARGKTIYNGSTLGAGAYFTALGHPTATHSNPADNMMSLVSTDFLHGDDIERGQDRIRSFAEAWKEHMDEVGNEKPRAPSTIAASSISARPLRRSKMTGLALLAAQTSTLTKRNYLNYSRNLLAYGIRLGMYIGMGVLVATVWVNMPQTDARINDRLSVHFFGVAFLGFMSVAGIPSFLEERAVLMREKRNNLYTAAPYVLANTAASLPFLAICTVFFAVIVYWSVGLHPGATPFFRFLAFVFLGVYAAECQSLLIAAIIPIFVAALAIAAFINGFWMVVQGEHQIASSLDNHTAAQTGYFVRTLPSFWKYWAHFIDYETFAFQLLVKNDFTGLVFKCSGSLADNTCLCSQPSTLVQTGQACALRGEEVVRSLGFDGISTTLYAFIL